jgi:hypothetical protein
MERPKLAPCSAILPPMDDLEDLAAILEAKGLLAVEGDELTLTAEGAALGRALAMGEGEEVLDALLDQRGDQEG